MNPTQSRPPSLWRLLRWLLVVAVAIPTVIALFYALENWRGARALAQLHRELAAAGRPTRLEEVIPPPVPDAQNLAMAPLFRHVFAYHRDPDTGNTVWNERTEAIRLEIFHRLLPPSAKLQATLGSWVRGERFDLTAWQAYYRELSSRSNRVGSPATRMDPNLIKRLGLKLPAVRQLPDDIATRYGEKTELSDPEYAAFLDNIKFPVPSTPGSAAADVLLAITSMDQELDGWAKEATARPLSRFPVHYEERPAWGILLPHLAKIKTVVGVLSLRATAYLHTGDTGRAHSAVLLGMRTADLSQGEVFSISQLVRFVSWQLILQPVWEGIEDHRWSEIQLAELERAMAGVDFPAGVPRCFQYYILHDPTPSSTAEREQLTRLGSDSDPALDALAQAFIRYAPRGWFSQNAARGAELAWEQLSNHLAWVGTPAVTNWVRPGATSNALPTPNSFLKLDEMLTKMTRSHIPESLRAQTWLHLARSAVALERYRLERAAYPTTLSDLVPRFLVRPLPDPIDSASLRYRLNPNGSYRLYSVGLDAVDDGGRPAGERVVGALDDAPWPQGDWGWPRTDQNNQ